MSDTFAKHLVKTLTYDKYLKVLDMSGNRLGMDGLSMIVKLALAENPSVVAFDARMNPGSTEKIMYQISLCLCKNIEKARSKGIILPKEWIRPALYSSGIPLNILHGIGLKHPDEIGKKGRRRRAGSSCKSKSALTRSVAQGSVDGGMNVQISGEVTMD